MKIRILVIDDDEDLLFIAEQYLTAQDPEFHLVQASTAQKAIQLLDEELFDAVICDFHLGPDQMNGLQILEWLRENGSTTPFIIFTGRSREEVAIQALNLGADYYLEKGDDLAGLFAEIGHHVKNVVRSRRIEEALKESEEKFRGIIEHISEAFYIMDKEQNLVYISPRLKDILGYEIEDFVFDYRRYLTDNPLNEESIRYGQHLIQTGEKIEPHRIEFYHKNGSKRMIELNESANFDEDGDIIGIIGVARDITENVRAEEALRDSETKYRLLFEKLSDGVFILDSEGTINIANPQVGLIFGYTPDEIIGTHVADYIHPDDRERILQMFSTALDSKLTNPDGVEIRGLRRDGSEIIINALSTVLIDNGKAIGVQSIIRDITSRRRAEDALRDSEAKYRLLFEKLSDGVFIFDSKGILSMANPQAGMIFGYTPEEIIGTHVTNYIHPDEREKVYQLVSSSLDTKQTNPDGIEFRGLKKDGSEIIFNALSTVLTHNGNPIGFQSIIRDITNRRRAEEALRESEAKYRRLFERLPDGVFIIDSEGIINIANPQTGLIFGYTPDEIIGTHIATYIHPDDRERIQRLFASSFESKQTSPDGIEIRGLKKDGSEITVNSLNTLLIQNGEAVGVQSIIRDITSRRRAEDALRESEEKYRTVVESSNQPITITTGPPPRIVYMNSAGEEMVGTSLEELTSLSDDEVAKFYGEEGWRKVNERFRLIMEDDFIPDPLGYENKITRKDGEVKWLQTHPSRIIFNGQKAVLAISEDRTELKRMLDELSASEEKFRTLVESMHDPVFVIDKDNRYTQVYYGHSFDLPALPEEYLGCTLHEALPKEIADLFEKAAQDVRETGNGGEYDYQRVVKGVNKWFSARLSLHEDGECVIAVVSDITDRKKIESDLRNADKEWRNTFDAIPDMVAVLNNKSEIIRANKKMAEVLGIEMDELVGKKCYEVLHNSSEPFPGCPHLITKTTDEPAESEIFDPNMGEPYLVTTSPIHDDDGEQIGVVHIAKSIANPVREELSELAHVMSHDLGNKMKNIRSLVSIAKTNPDDALPRIDSIAQQSLDLLQSSAELVDAGMKIEKREKVDLDIVVNSIAKTTLPDSIIFHCDDLPTVFGSPEKISQIFQNLFINALEHGNPSVIEVRNVEVGKGTAIVISNDGTPIPEVERPKIFRRGFTTKPNGTGLGLSIVEKLVEEHGWDISLDSGNKTAFIITLNPR